jgi:Tfp pilus assembly protein PilP
MVQFAFLLVLVACEPQLNPSSDLTAPVQDVLSEPTASLSGDTPASVPEEGFDFGGDVDGVEDVDVSSEPVTDAELQARLLGIPAPVKSATDKQTEAAASGAEEPLPSIIPEVTTRNSLIDPSQPLTGSWGLRLVSTVSDADPPRAILGFLDGHEEVVQAGALLPAEGVAVLAIGKDMIQIAEIIPAGDHARVESRVITALFPQEVAN